MRAPSKEFRFEEALHKLEECVEKLDSQDTTLEESIALYEQCVLYHRLCSEMLEKARQRVEIYRPETDSIEEFGGEK